MPFSRLLTVRQHFPDHRLSDIPSEVRRRLEAAAFAGGLRLGSRIAIGVGSRGISNIATIVRAAVDYWKDAGMQPFLFPAMGSHGAASAEGQKAVLEHFGISAETMGCPVISQLDVVSAGTTQDGIEAFIDRAAFESDGIMLIGRVKWHTDFSGGIESGLFKMMAIGLGKFAGARRYHTYAYRLGLECVIRSIGRQVLSTGKVLGGLAILEDAHHNTAMIAAVPVPGMERREEELLAVAKSWMPRIPFDLDILIVDEMGKNFSGAGLDTKVINRGVYGETNQWDTAPRIERVFVRDLSDGSYGNAVGVGMADVVHDRILSKIDWAATQVNSLTSNTPPCIRTPIHFPSDLLCLEKIWPTVGRFECEQVRVGWIRNTLELATIGVTENLLPEIQANPQLEVVAPVRDWPFDAEGNLPG